jgi:2-octaprenyl-6-methoxyphenol hydroxylase
MRETTDILISGGGVAGLTAACAFGSAGFRVICVDPTPPVTDAEADDADLRTTAFLQPSIAVLDAAGLWSRLQPQAAALQVMRIIDAGGPDPEPRLTKDFDAADISDAPFGWNLPNWLLRREMVARLAELPNVSFRPGLGFARMVTRQTEALVTLTNGTCISARLVVGADGRASPVRDALGIGARTMRYGQKALAFAVAHDIPHENISTEVHRTGGPFTLVPLPDRNGRPASAVVWMDRGPEIARLAALPVPDFEAEMTARSSGVLGPLTLLSRRSVWPIISQIADRLSGPRAVLIAEAAHVLPPIGAQGLNMSLADLAALKALAEQHRDDPGQPAVTDAYHRQRHFEVQARVTGIDLLNRASMVSAPTLRDLRATALNALYSARPIRQALMRAGLGLRKQPGTSGEAK